MIVIPDFTKVIFVNHQYLKYVFLTITVIFSLYVIYSLRIWLLHKKFGGYEHSKSLAQKAKTRIDGPIRLGAKTILMIVISLLLGLTLLGPKIKESKTENEYEPAQIVIAMDNSISMLAEDVIPSRLVAVKSVIYNVLERLEKEGSKDKVGLIRFTDIAIPAVVIPTRDYNLIAHELKLTTPSYLRMFEKNGTNIWDAVTQGLDMFSYLDDQGKILIIISDGEQVSESEYIDKIRKEAIDKRKSDAYFQLVKIFIIGIGKGSEPALVPKEKDDAGNVLEFYVQTDGPNKGALITTSPDLSYLEEIKNLVDAELISSENQTELNENLDKILSKQRKIIGVNENVSLKDVSPWFIGAALIFLFLIPIVRLG